MSHLLVPKSQKKLRYLSQVDKKVIWSSTFKKDILQLANQKVVCHTTQPAGQFIPCKFEGIHQTKRSKLQYSIFDIRYRPILTLNSWQSLEISNFHTYKNTISHGLIMHALFPKSATYIKNKNKN